MVLIPNQVNIQSNAETVQKSDLTIKTDGALPSDEDPIYSDILIFNLIFKVLFINLFYFIYLF